MGSLCLLKCFRYSSGRYSDPHCNYLKNKQKISDDDEDDEGGSPYDDEFQELEEAVYRYPMGDPDHDDIDLVNKNFFFNFAPNQSSFFKLINYQKHDQ